MLPSATASPPGWDQLNVYETSQPCKMLKANGLPFVASNRHSDFVFVDHQPELDPKRYSSDEFDN